MTERKSTSVCLCGCVGRASRETLRDTRADPSATSSVVGVVVVVVVVVLVSVFTKCFRRPCYEHPFPNVIVHSS